MADGPSDRPGPVEDLFSSLPEVREAGEDVVAEAFSNLIAQPGWLMLTAYISKVRTTKALAFGCQAGGNSDQVAMEAAYMRGYLAGLKDTVESAERLVEIHRSNRRLAEDRESRVESPRERAIRFARGGM